MHTEDKLSAEQRLRLEALNQAVMRNSMSGKDAREVVEDAKVFEHFIRSGKNSVASVGGSVRRAMS